MEDQTIEDIEKVEMISTRQVSDNLVDLDPVPLTNIPTQVDESKKSMFQITHMVLNMLKHIIIFLN